MTDNIIYPFTREPTIAIDELTAHLATQACYIREFCEINSAWLEASIDCHEIVEREGLAKALDPDSSLAQRHIDNDLKDQAIEYAQAVYDLADGLKTLIEFVSITSTAVRRNSFPCV